MNLKARRLKTARDVGADCCLPFEHRLTGKDDNGIIAPIGYDLIDVLAGRSEIGPLCIPAEQRLALIRSIEMSLRAAKKGQENGNEYEIA